MTASNQPTDTAKRNMVQMAHQLGMPPQQIRNFLSAGYCPQPKQMLFHAAARACDAEDGPDQVGFGGARGPGKSHASFAQVAFDDCRRVPNLKVLYLRKVGKQAREQFEDMRRSILSAITHDYDKQQGVIHLWNRSRILIGHFNHENDIDNYLGIEYDVILIEEATTLTHTKYRALRDSNRSAKRGWRPRIYTTTNPGNIGHTWYRKRFIIPYRDNAETTTRFIPALVYDNKYIDQGYRKRLEENTGWRYRAYVKGDWDIAAGQYFTEFDFDTHVIEPFELPPHFHVWLSMDYGYTHPTVWTLLAEDYDGNIYVIDELRQARWLPARHAPAVRALLKRHHVNEEVLNGVVAGGDVFHRRGDKTIAEQYEDEEIYLKAANMDRTEGAAAVNNRLGGPNKPATLSIASNCHHLTACIPAMQHDPKRPEDVLKIDVDDDGDGGDDCYDSLRYGIMAAGKPAGPYASAPPPDPIAEADKAGW